MITFADSEVQKERLDICNKCEFKQPDMIDTCKVCGCYIKFKVMIPKTKCPKDKWER